MEHCYWEKQWLCWEVRMWSTEDQLHFDDKCSWVGNYSCTKENSITFWLILYFTKILFENEIWIKNFKKKFFLNFKLLWCYFAALTIFDLQMQLFFFCNHNFLFEDNFQVLGGGFNNFWGKHQLIHIYQPLRSGRIWHKVNFLSGV